MASQQLQQLLQTKALVDGTALITTGPTQVNTTWHVTQVSVTAFMNKPTVSGSCGAAIYLNEVLVCASSAGQQDTADNDPEITVPAGSSLQIQWSGCKSGTTCTALLNGTMDTP